MGNYPYLGKSASAYAALKSKIQGSLATYLHKMYSVDWNQTLLSNASSGVAD